jgi:Type II secretion system (T2SS), protein K
MVKPSCKRDSGAALLLALWALFLLAGVVFAWALNINSRLTVSGTASRVLSAEAMASSGAEVALNPTIKPASANLHKKMGNESYDVEMTGECGRFNLNLLAPGGVENPVLIAALRQYLNIKGVDLNDLDVMMDSLLDWITPTKGLHRLNAPDETDDYRPTHAPLTSVDELKRIAGWAEYTSQPDWDEDFTTIIGGCQQIDAAYASRNVLRAFGIPDEFVDRFLQVRRGQDGVDGTEDDPQMDQAMAFSLLGLGAVGIGTGTPTAPGQSPQGSPQGTAAGIQNVLVFKSPNPVFRIVSVGKSGDITRSVEMIVLKQQAGIGQQQGGVGQLQVAVGRPQVFSWKEL